MKKRILVDMHLFDGNPQGSRTYLKGLYSELILLSKCDFIFYFLASDIENLKTEFGDYEHVKYVKLRSRNRFIRLLLEIPWIMWKFQIDYSHFQYIAPIIKIGRFVVTTHDILFEQNEFKSFFPLKYKIVNSFLFRFSAKRADLLLTVSNYSKIKISKLYNIPLNKIHVTANAVEKGFANIPSSQKEFELSKQKYILYVSRVEPRKNHLLLLKSFIELGLPSKGFNLVLIGSFDFPSIELLSFIEHNKDYLEDAVFWKQNVPYADVKRYYKNCELFIFPSIAEGFGIPVLEALRFQKKVLVSDSTAMKDFDLPKEMLFNPFDKEDLKEKLHSLLFQNNNDYSKQYNAILNKFDWKISANVLFKLLKSGDSNEI